MQDRLITIDRFFAVRNRSAMRKFGVMRVASGPGGQSFFVTTSEGCSVSVT